jgi:hypothetical protein
MKKQILYFILLATSCTTLGYRDIGIVFPDQDINALPPHPVLSQVVFFNERSFFSFRIDQSNILNIYVDQQAVTSLRPGQFVILHLTKGAHTVEIEHLDVWFHRPKEEIYVDTDVSYYKVFSADFHGLIKVDSLPKNFHSYKYNISPVRKGNCIDSCCIFTPFHR